MDVVSAFAASAPRAQAPRLAPAWRVATALLVADLRERTRSLRFRVVALGVILSAWWCLPPIGAGYLVVAIGDHHRGFYSSAWIGMVIAMLSILWGLVGFYLVRGTVQRDIDTRVWQLLGTTSMRRGAYLLAKWASHLVVMGGLVVAALAVGLVAQWVRAEDRQVDLWELVKPSLFIALPTLSVSAALAIWFDVIPLLRRTVGNIAFFVVWMALITAGAVGLEHDQNAHGAGTRAAQPWTSDLAALDVMQWSIHHQIARQIPAAAEHDGFCIGCGEVSAPTTRFIWTAWDVPAAVLWGRLLWLAGALAAVLLAAPLLDRAAARPVASSAAGRARAPRSLRWLRTLLRPLQATSTGTLVAAEVFVVLRGRALWWWAAWLALWGVQLFGPRHAVALAMLGSWTLLLDLFSRIGLRDVEHRTHELVGTAPGGVRRLLLARIAASVGLAWLATAPGALHAGFAHPAIGAAAVTIGASIALWGLAAATLARSSRPFELVYLAVAYATTQGLPWLDAGARGSGVALAHAVGIAIALGVLLVRSAAARWR